MNNRGTDTSFPRYSRLTTPSDYSFVFKGKNFRVSNRLWTVLAVKSDKGECDVAPARLGLAIAKKRARRAVDRNRCKRVIRESFRSNRHRLQGYSLVVMNRDDCVKASKAELRLGIEQLLDNLLTRSGVNNSKERKRGKT